MSAADKFKSQMDYGLSYNLNRLRPSNKKNSSVSNFRDRYK